MLEQRVKLGEGGRVVIPALLRKALDVEPGDELVIRIQDGELRLFQQKQALTHIRKVVNLKRRGKNATDDFLAFRKKDSK